VLRITDKIEVMRVEAPRSASRGRAGFTLTELMVVVAILAIAVGVAARVSSKAPRSDRAAAFARTMVQSAHEARQAALTFGQPTRLRVVSASSQLVSERFDSVSGTWVTLGGVIQAPGGVQLCDTAATPVLTTSSPACPTTIDSRVCFGTNGRVTYTTTDTCDPSSAGTGATLYAQTLNGAQKYKLVLYRLTGMPKIMDQWQ
jgi:prepilin-type N-terminal cleavage/methylation domain-containing protein